MFKLSTLSAAFFAIAATSASACVSYDDVTDVFTSRCATEQDIVVRTIGGGCYTQELLTFSLKPGESKSFPRLSVPCDGIPDWNVTFGWSDTAK